MTTISTTETQGTGAHADVNGLHLYYETHGEGRPLILLHGGLGAGEMFAPVIPAFTAAARSSRPTCRATAGRPTSTGRSTSG
jgi:pimeloyl-ACP methyl ester carboxylesterase